MSEFLPLTLDVEQVTITEAGDGWDILIERDDAGDIGFWTKSPDPIYDQLVDSGDIVYDEEVGEVVKNEQ